MGTATRRLVLLGSVSCAALLGAYHLPAGLTAPDFFVEKPNKEAVSFNAAHARLKDIIAKEIELSQKDFGYKYAPGDVTRIHDRVWDSAKLALSEFYLPLESRSQNDPPTAVGGRDDGGIGPVRR